MQTTNGTEIETRELPNGLIRQTITIPVASRSAQRNYTLDLTLTEDDLVWLRDELSLIIRKRKARRRRRK